MRSPLPSAAREDMLTMRPSPLARSVGRKACTSSMGARRCRPTTSSSWPVVAVSMVPGRVAPALLTRAVTLKRAAMSCAAWRVAASFVRSAWNDCSSGWLQSGSA
jgi:hypothetical protein